MLGGMVTRIQAKKLIQELRERIDPKFAIEIRAVADSLEEMADGAAKGGRARAKRLSKKQRSAIARKAANVRWGNREKLK